MMKTRSLAQPALRADVAAGPWRRGGIGWDGWARGTAALDPTSFDHLTRRFAHRCTRRRLLGALSAAVALFAIRRLAHAQAGPDGGIPLGGACAATGECSRFQGCSEAAAITCADNGITEDGPLNCCLSAGGLCGDDRHCCGGLLCLDTGGDGCGAGTCQVGDGTSAGDCTTHVTAPPAPTPAGVPSGVPGLLGRARHGLYLA
jgi:hypothetical protein